MSKERGASIILALGVSLKSQFSVDVCLGPSQLPASWETGGFQLGVSLPLENAVTSLCCAPALTGSSAAASQSRPPADQLSAAGRGKGGSQEAPKEA